MHKITEAYKDQIKSYDDFRIKVEVLVRELLIQSSINFHKIESRIKDPQKLEEKIHRKNDKYTDIKDITDIIGIRVITYLEDEVDKVASIIQDEFVLDRENSIDKRQLESDRFGYKSLHYVVSLTNQRKNLTEYKRFKDIKIEIQIRSVLQHAWAEIEHDIGYKGELAIPDVLKRSFYRVAALLETADIEFVNIRKSLSNYESTVTEDIRKHPEDVDLNAASLKAFIENNKLIIKLDEQIIAENELAINSERTDTSFLLEKLYFLDIKTIKQLDNALIENKAVIPSFAKEWMSNSPKGGRVPPGISIFYLCYVLVGKKADKKFAESYYEKNFRSKGGRFTGPKIIETYKNVTK